MHAAFRRIDIIGKGNNLGGVTVVILEGYFRKGIVLFSADINDMVIQRRFILVQKSNVFPNSAFITEHIPVRFFFSFLFRVPFFYRTIIFDGNCNSCIEKSLLLHSGMKNIVVVDQLIKDFPVRFKSD